MFIHKSDTYSDEVHIDHWIPGSTFLGHKYTILEP